MFNTVVLVYADIATTFLPFTPSTSATTATLAMCPGVLLFAMGRPGFAGPRWTFVLFGIRLCVFTQLHRVGDPGTALRHWHGRRVGAGSDLVPSGGRLPGRCRSGHASGYLPPVQRCGDELAVVAVVVRPKYHPGSDQLDHPVPRGPKGKPRVTRTWSPRPESAMS